MVFPENARKINKFRQELLIGGYSDKTIKMYETYLRDFLEFIKTPAETASRDDIIAYLAKKKEKDGLSNASLALIHSALKFFFHSFLKMKIADEVKIPRKEKKLPTVLSRAEIKALIKSAKRGRDRLIIEFLYSSGVRVSECAKIRLDDLELGEGIAMVRGGKGKKDRVIILAKRWISGFKKYLKRRKVQGELVFTKKNGKPITPDTIQRIVKRASLKAGIHKHVTPHSLRHSYATHLLEAGENIRKIQELLGHAALNTTQIYTKVSTDELKKVRSPLDGLTRPRSSTN